MKKKISLIFYKNLLLTDFLIIRNKYKSSSIFVNFLLEITIDKSIVCLNILELFKSLKQFLRILFFLKQKKSLILFYIPNKQYRTLLNEYFISFLKLTNIVFVQNLQLKLPEKYFRKIKVKKLVSKKIYTIFFTCLGFDQGLSFSSLLQKELFLFLTVNSTLNNFQLGDYRIFNNMIELQKFFFLVLLTKQVLKN